MQGNNGTNNPGGTWISANGTTQPEFLSFKTSPATADTTSKTGITQQTTNPTGGNYNPTVTTPTNTTGTQYTYNPGTSYYTTGTVTTQPASTSTVWHYNELEAAANSLVIGGGTTTTEAPTTPFATSPGYTSETNNQGIQTSWNLPTGYDNSLNGDRWSLDVISAGQTPLTNEQILANTAVPLQNYLNVAATEGNEHVISYREYSDGMAGSLYIDGKPVSGTNLFMAGSNVGTYQNYSAGQPHIANGTTFDLGDGTILQMQDVNGHQELVVLQGNALVHSESGYRPTVTTAYGTVAEKPPTVYDVTVDVSKTGRYTATYTVDGKTYTVEGNLETSGQQRSVFGRGTTDESSFGLYMGSDGHVHVIADRAEVHATINNYDGTTESEVTGIATGGGSINPVSTSSSTITQSSSSNTVRDDVTITSYTKNKDGSISVTLQNKAGEERTTIVGDSNGETLETEQIEFSDGTVAAVDIITDENGKSKLKVDKQHLATIDSSTVDQNSAAVTHAQAQRYREDGITFDSATRNSNGTIHLVAHNSAGETLEQDVVPGQTYSFPNGTTFIADVSTQSDGTEKLRPTVTSRATVPMSTTSSSGSGNTASTGGGLSDQINAITAANLLTVGEAAANGYNIGNLSNAALTAGGVATGLVAVEDDEIEKIVQDEPEDSEVPEGELEKTYTTPVQSTTSSPTTAAQTAAPTTAAQTRSTVPAGAKVGMPESARSNAAGNTSAPISTLPKATTAAPTTAPKTTAPKTKAPATTDSRYQTAAPTQAPVLNQSTGSGSAVYPAGYYTRSTEAPATTAAPRTTAPATTAAPRTTAPATTGARYQTASTTAAPVINASTSYTPPVYPTHAPSTTAAPTTGSRYQTASTTAAPVANSGWNVVPPQYRSGTIYRSDRPTTNGSR